MVWIRTVIALLIVGCGLWVFSPSSHKPVEVHQMQIGFLENEQIEWLPVMTGDENETKQVIDEVVTLFESATISDGISCFVDDADIEVFVLNLNKNQYVIDGRIHLTDEGGIYQDRNGGEDKYLSQEAIEYLQQLKK